MDMGWRKAETGGEEMNWLGKLLRLNTAKRFAFDASIRDVIYKMRSARFHMWTHDRGLVDMPELYEWSRQLEDALHNIDAELVKP